MPQTESVPPDAPPPFTILIPAHNEEAVIGRTLRTILEGAPQDKRPEIIVLCNGCRDRTADRAREASPEAQVVELPVGSKTLALNEGLKRASAFPILVVDADSKIAFKGLEALAAVLREPNVKAASPAAEMDVAQCDFWTRTFYRVWDQHSYLHEGVGGSGIYGLSEVAVRQLGQFPNIIADDTWVRWSFPVEEQRRLSTAADGAAVLSVVQAPRRAIDLIRCEARWHAGNVQLRSMMSEPQTPITNGKPESRWKGRTRLGDKAVFYGIKLLGRALFHWNRRRGRAGVWHRDETGR